MFSGTDDLVEQVGYWLSHPEERAAIAEAGHRRALAEHTYDHRFAAIFSAAEPCLTESPLTPTAQAFTQSLAEMLCPVTPARPRLFGQQALTVPVDHRLGLLRNGEDLVLEDGEVVVWSIRAYRVEHLEQRRPSRRIVGRRRRGGEEPSVVDDEAVHRMSQSDRPELPQHRTLVVRAGSDPVAPVTVEEVQRRRLVVGELGESIYRVALQRLHMGKVLEQAGGLAVEISRALDRGNRREDSS